MVWKGTKIDQVIRAGEFTLEYTCGGCQKTLEHSFTYNLRHVLIEHHGQCVEGDVEEWLRIVTDLPEQLQCGECGAVHEVNKSPAIYANYSNPKGSTIYSEFFDPQNFGSKDNIDGDLEKSLRRVSARFVIVPGGI